jgi:hypothetical protein
MQLSGDSAYAATIPGLATSSNAAAGLKYQIIARDVYGNVARTSNMPVMLRYSAIFIRAGAVAPETPWGITVDGVRHASLSDSQTIPGLLGTASYRYDTEITSKSGAKYVCDTNCTGTASITDNSRSATYNVSQYELWLDVRPRDGSGGIITPDVSGWWDVGAQVLLSASPNSGYVFSSWSGEGTGNYTGTNNPVIITMNSPITQTANFLKLYSATFSREDLLAGLSWGVTVNGQHYVSTASSLTAPNLAGTASYVYDEIAGEIPEIPDTRYHCSSGCTGTVRITDSSKSASYTKQYPLAITIDPSAGGTTTPAAGRHWYDAYSTATAAAAANADYKFWYWSGTGVVSDVENPSQLITMNLPRTLIANFKQRFDFSMSLTETSGIIKTGQARATTIKTYLTAGEGEAVSLSCGGLPAGISCSFGNNPCEPSVPGSDSSLTIFVTSSTEPGTYPVTITGRSAERTHSTSYSLTVEPNPIALAHTPVDSAAKGQDISLSATATSANDIYGMSVECHVFLESGEEKGCFNGLTQWYGAMSTSGNSIYTAMISGSATSSATSLWYRISVLDNADNTASTGKITVTLT